MSVPLSCAISKELIGIFSTVKEQYHDMSIYFGSIVNLTILSVSPFLIFSVLLSCHNSKYLLTTVKTHFVKLD